jgi:hypothetical protein
MIFSTSNNGFTPWKVCPSYSPRLSSSALASARCALGLESLLSPPMVVVLVAWWSFAVAVKVRAKTSRTTTSCRRSRLPQASSQLQVHYTLPPPQEQPWYVAFKIAWMRMLMLRDYRHEIARRRSQCCSASASSKRQI